MPRKFLTPVDLAYNALQNALAHPLASDPSGLAAGQAGALWFNQSTGKLKFWNGSTAIDVIDRAQQTGSQLAATISDLASTVQAYRLDQFAAATNPITIPNGTAAGHAVNRSQLDAVAASAATGTSIKDPARAATTANIALASTGNGASIDGVTIATGDRVLVKNQTTASENGIYVTGASSLTRAPDMDTTGEVKPGTLVYVTEGATNGDKQWAVTSDAAITVGTTAMTWGQITGGGTSYTGTAPVVVTGSNITLAYAGGLTVTGGNLVVDTTVVGRKLTGIIPASTSGAFSITGGTVTVNHQLNNWGARATVRYYTSPGSGNTAGALLEVDDVASDANNIVLTLPAAPAANQYFVSVAG